MFCAAQVTSEQEGYGSKAERILRYIVELDDESGIAMMLKVNVKIWYFQARFPDGGKVFVRKMDENFLSLILFKIGWPMEENMAKTAVF